MSADPCGDTPIACSLDAGSLADRVDEWRALVATSVDQIQRLSMDDVAGHRVR